MIFSGILNPSILNLLARVRHTNLLVIADRGFPFWPEIDTVDISLVDGIPSVLDVVAAVRNQAHFGQAWMASEFQDANSAGTVSSFEQALNGLNLVFEPHELAFKKRVPDAVGLIRTGDTTQFANVILESA